MRFGPALKAACLCLIIGGSAVGYVWQKDQLRQLSDQIGSTERRLGELKTANEKLRRQLSEVRSPGSLDRMIQHLNLGLTRPLPGQVVRLEEPSDPTLTGVPGPTQLAAGETGSLSR